MEKEILTADFSEILGQQNVKTQLKSALIAKRNVIIVGPPGIGKTTLAKAVANALSDLEVMDCGFHCLPDRPVCPVCKEKQGKRVKLTGLQRFVRVQGSPDLTAEDLIGDIDPIKALKFGPLSLEAFTPGKIFKANNGILFFDEINRCSEKLQNTLLQVLEEKQVTIGSYDVDVKSDFLFIGTMNPEDSSTEKLSDVFLDRFDLIEMTYPKTHEIEEAIVESRVEWHKDVTFPDALKVGVIAFIRQLRNDKNIEKKPSVRATIGVITRAQALARVLGNKVVTLDEIKSVIVSVLGHRIAFKASMKYLQDPQKYVEEKFAEFALDHNMGGEG